MRIRASVRPSVPALALLAVVGAGCAAGGSGPGWTLLPGGNPPGSDAVAGATAPAADPPATPSSAPTAPPTDDPTPPGPAGTALTVSESEFKIELLSSQLAAGEIDVTIANKGKVEHEFVIARSDIGPEALPTASDETVEEQSSAITHITEAEDIKPGETRKITPRLSPGRYVVFCNIPGHYAAGMRATFLVVPSDNW